MQDEIALLLGSTPTTKKVQSIFEEAMKMRAAEEFEEIELGWHGTPQRQLEGKSQAATVQVSARTDGAAESRPVKAPVSAKSLPEEPWRRQPAKPEPRKRGRPRKAEEEPNAEKKAAPEAGKRQKSLFRILNI